MNDTTLFIGRGTAGPSQIRQRYANRHGLIAGATGTGKTVTLQVLAEGFLRAGVPVFAADVKGDLSGISQAAVPSPKLAARAARCGFEPYTPMGFPAVPWDLLGENGLPLRTTVSDLGPLLFSHLLALNEVQEGVMNIAFRLADEEGLLLLDLKDLRALLEHLADKAGELSGRYGLISPASVAAIQRALLVLENQGANRLFGEPALKLDDLLAASPDGLGTIHLLAADQLLQRPRLYATFMLWLLSELFENLPEVGDPPKPRLVFFFDEAHLLFDNAPRALLDKVEQVVRLIRSKGVGIYFITQNPLDIPERVLGQLGNRVQHALRAYTPRDQKAVRAAAETFRQNPNINTQAAITELAVGEALVSVLEDKGVPSPVDRVLIRPPVSRIGPITAPERAALISATPLAAGYQRAIDRTSAYELLQQRAAAAPPPRMPSQSTDSGGPPPSYRGRSRQSTGEALIQSMARSVGSQLGRALLRGLLGSMQRRR